MGSKFISNKLIKELRSNNKFSKPIIRISILSIAISILVMLIAVSIVKGFQNEIKTKIVNFGSHFQIMAGGSNYSFESSPILRNKNYIDQLLSIDGVSKVQTFALKPGLIQSKADTLSINEEEVKIVRDIEGVIFKGVNFDFNWANLESKIIQGTSFRLDSAEVSDKIIISKFLSQQLKLNINDPIACYFIKGKGPSLKKFIVSGIYETGLEEFDKQFTFIDIRHIQKLNDWGVQANLFLNDKCQNGWFEIKAIASGSDGKYLYNWGEGYTSSANQLVCVKKDTTIQLILSNYSLSSGYEKLPTGIPDTAWLTIRKKDTTTCGCDGEEGMNYDALSNSKRRYISTKDTITTKERTSGGSMQHYIGGYEVFIHDFNQIEAIDQQIGVSEDLLNVSKITDVYREIFGWLNILDTNVLVIIILMIMVATINIISLLLVLIIERSSMIGLLKSFGAENFTIQRIFISLGGFILWRGLWIGNILSFGILFLQNTFGFIKLPQENYYLNTVPMSYEWLSFLLLNLLTIGIGYVVLYLVSLFIAKINPIKTIKFN